ncbi:MAG TPA: carboxypeptidase-like regulatory domain-containing protein [Prolixibacteraceae bacterium]|nr:carboxypeptidase-like regulatory domain-containing protein [Prolixibacteraceae bacterium]
MKQLLSITFILLFFSLVSQAQAGIATLKGKVIDQETKEGIAFVSIGIQGTFLGTATNPEGNFEIRIPEGNQSENLYFSAIGFKNVSFPISDFLKRPNILIELSPQSYHIEEIDVAAESRVLQRILRTASERIPQNYLSGPMNLRMYFEERKSTDNEASHTTKTIVDLYDTKGYADPSWSDAFKNRSYQIAETQRETPTVAFRDASNNLDELLEMDVARLSNTILNPSLLNDFSLKLEAKTRLNGDSVWIISYDALKLDLAHTGSFYPTSLRGKIYISFTDYAVLRNEIKLTEKKSNPQGRSLAVNSNPLTNTQMNVTSGYKKVDGKSVLASIDSEKQYTSSEKQLIYESEKVVVLNVETKQTRKINGRDYFAEAKSNESFWQNFAVPVK